MRILFILKEPLMHERLGVMYLSSILKSQGHIVRLAMAGRLGYKGLFKLMEGFSPEIVGYSAMTGEHLKLLEINKVLKKKYKYLAVFGGPHATFFPELIKEDGCDALCVGEGEVAFTEFCRRYSRDENYWQSPNFIVRHNEGIVSNPLSPLIENLDELPFPDRDLMYEADPSLINVSYKMFFSARGCPNKCTYCFNRRYNQMYKDKGPIVRIRSAQSLVNEICAVRDRYPLGIVHIDDDTFILKPKSWFGQFCQLYKEKVGLTLTCNMRAEHVSDELIAMLKDAGLETVWMGVECGNEALANRLLERGLKNEQIVNAAKIIKNHGVKLATQNLIGLPVANSYQVDLQTLDLNLKLKPIFAWSSILYPYPGTPIEQYSREEGFLEKEAPVLETNKRSSVFNFSRQQKRQIENLHKLFGLVIRFPFLRKHCDLLCRLPLTGLYNGLFYLWYGYNYKIKIYPFLSIRKELANYISLWWRLIRKS